ncbi:serine/threonine protein kinase [Planotetraspora sp. A-T 1434]|uniref:serine/threonine-protein kinase n=1 Tax=Planotetraspora sp. A-T 1434 TaxID=2979219 RepID=UPI0021BFD28C|nr:serine/threonine-protein kinase [Planotetraspora sp. A-T 1434]MCT9931214.1 serine/threonine protein kinase [Planotetraspora sp. A-T 1434]
MVAPLDPDDPRALGEFRLNGRLGEGGQGVVYLGHTPGGEPVAVKILKAGLDPAVRERLTRELDAMRSVAPFCTARVITAVVEGREPYVVSEFIDGPSLQQRVSTGGPLRGGELDRLAVGTATALAAIHGAGIVHRDFKPGNVLLGPDGPRVVDFGIARQGESDTITAGPIGTPAYLAPEQIAGHPASPASDVFAWGATMVFAATGRPAFGADSVASVLHRIMTTHPDVSAVPASLRSVVERCLDKDPAARPTSRDLLLELVGSARDPLGAGTAAAVSPGPAGRPGVQPASHGGAQRTGYQGEQTSGHPGGEPGAHWTGPPASQLTGHGAPATEPRLTRRKSRAGVITGTAAATAALAVTAALLVPRLLPSSGTAAASSPAPSAASSAGAKTPTASGTATDTADGTATGTADGTATPASTQSTGDTTTGDTGGGGKGATIPAAFAGTWRGHITPTPAGFTDEYDIEIVLRRGQDKGRWKEPANSCDGTLTLIGATGSEATFLLRNAGDCVPGTVNLTTKGATLAYEWNDDLGVLKYNGLLAKVG